MAGHSPGHRLRPAPLLLAAAVAARLPDLPSWPPVVRGLLTGFSKPRKEPTRKPGAPAALSLYGLTYFALASTKAQASWQPCPVRSATRPPAYLSKWK